MPHLSIYAPVDTTGFNNRSVKLMKKYKDLNFVNRAVNPTLQKLTLPDPDNPKGYMSHKMSYAEHDGQNFAFPGVVQDKGKLKYLPGIKGAKYAIQHKQLIPLGNDNNFADYFTTVGYKYNMNPDVYNEAMQDYIDNTSIKPGIPKFSFTPKPFVSSFTLKYKKGGKTKNWIQSAVKPSHKGYCTPMSKPTCTPRRKALARTFKKMGKARKHQFGGYLSPTPEYVLPKINFDALTQKFPSYLEQQQQPKKINTFSADEVLPILDKFEGFRPRVYKDGKGNLTIGHGLTDAKYLKRGFITRSDSLQGVKEHLNTQVLPKLESMSYWNNLNDNQKVALSSYVYNIGWNNFTKKSPNLQKALQSNDWNSVVKNLDFGYSDRANPGLRKRRDYERNLFLNSNETQTLKKGGNLTKDYIKVAEYHKYLESKHTK